MANTSLKSYIPQRNHIVWLDFDPTKGKEIGKYRSALVLSSEAYNRQSGLFICCPISTSVRGVSTEVSVYNIDNEHSVVVANLIQTLSWKERKVKFISEADPNVINEVLLRMLPLIGADQLIEKLLEDIIAS